MDNEFDSRLEEIFSNTFRIKKATEYLEWYRFKRLAYDPKVYSPDFIYYKENIPFDDVCLIEIKGTFKALAKNIRYLTIRSMLVDSIMEMNKNGSIPNDVYLIEITYDVKRKQWVWRKALSYKWKFLNKLEDIQV